ncbi:MAG: TetR/AcrR family transcriptional regulator [Deltaproteobacteria bacterium]|nr:MAG: TetR/AcrR family transcriptional regulator [Deltaproteobacteria bacterium]RLC17875.1 MAG: TetR/AcrR family transcriptional regulator [Deltaproteobacteria bacterium]
MIVYFNLMRIKDDIKQDALFEATIKLVNEIGFAASSVSKIAKEAGISPATIYVYHKNKEELLVSTYIQVKKTMGAIIHENFDDSLPIRDILKTIWFKMFHYIARHPDYFQYTEQFSNSPYQSLVDKHEIEKYFDPVIHVLLRGIEQKIIKNVNFDILTAFIFYPIVALSNARVCQDFEVTDENIETAFTLAWDAIKL